MILKPPKLGNNVFIVGNRYGGKTFLAQQLAQYYKDVIYFDINGFLKPAKSIKEIIKTDDLKEALKYKGHIVVVPKKSQRNQKAYAWFFDQLASKARRVVVVIDECFLIGKMNSLSYPAELQQLLATGRHRFVSPWIIVQRPKFVPSNAMALADHWFVFPVPQQDLPALEDKLPKEAVQEIIDLKNKPKYSFVHIWNDEGDIKWQTMPRIES